MRAPCYVGRMVRYKNLVPCVDEWPGKKFADVQSAVSNKITKFEFPYTRSQAACRKESISPFICYSNFAKD